MSSPIMPSQGPLGPPISISQRSTAAQDLAALMSGLASNDPMLAIAAARATPPPEILEQMAAAARIEEQLRRDGHELRFAAPAPGERVAIELRDGEGNTTRTLSIAEALELAVGKALA